jgi:hypothetical protein
MTTADPALKRSSRNGSARWLSDSTFLNLPPSLEGPWRNQSSQVVISADAVTAAVDDAAKGANALLHDATDTFAHRRTGMSAVMRRPGAAGALLKEGHLALREPMATLWIELCQAAVLEGGDLAIHRDLLGRPAKGAVGHAARSMAVDRRRRRPQRRDGQRRECSPETDELRQSLRHRLEPRGQTPLAGAGNLQNPAPIVKMAPVISRRQGCLRREPRLEPRQRVQGLSRRYRETEAEEMMAVDWIEVHARRGRHAGIP